MDEGLPKTAKEAREVGSKYYFTGNPCNHGHTTKKLASNYGCYACSKIKYNTWAEANKDLIKARNKKYREDNQEYFKDYNHRWSQDNKEHKALYNRKYLENNRELFVAKAAKRRASKLQRTPTWLSPEHLNEIKEMYQTSPQGYHVDHIVPLQGANVSGLHVPWNLQHLPASDNLQKSNSF